MAIDINCSAAVADEVEALEDDIRGAAAVHPNRPILQIQRIHQDWMAQGCSRRPSDHAQSFRELKLVVPIAMWLLVLTMPR